MREQNISLPIRGDQIGTIIYEFDEINFEGNVVFNNTYGSLDHFHRLELINDVMGVLRIEYDRLKEVMRDEIAERKAEEAGEGDFL